MAKAMIDNTHRQRTSLAREWDFQVIAIAAGQPYSGVVDVRRVAGAAVFIPAAMTCTYLTVYSAIEENNVYFPVRNKDGTLLTVPVTAGGKVLVLPAEVFPLGWIKLAACSNNTGTLANEAAARTLVIVVKP